MSIAAWARQAENGKPLDGRLFSRLRDSELIAEIGDAMNHGWVVGTSRFKGEVEALTNRRARMGQPGRPSEQTKDGRQQ